MGTIRGIGRVAGVAFALAAVFASGCTCEGLKPHAAIAITGSKLADESDAQARLWSGSASGGVVSFRGGGHAWASHLWQGSAEPWWPAGLTAVSWAPTDSGETWERVYYGGTDGRVHEGGFTPGVADFQWLGLSSHDVRPLRYGALHALVASGAGAPGGEPPRYVATTLQDSTAYDWLVIWERVPPAFDAQYIDVGSGSAPPKRATNVFGAVLGAVPCFFVADADGKLKTYWLPSGGVWHSATGLGQPSDVALHGHGSAAGWLDLGEARVSAFVRDTGDRLWEARFSQPGQPAEWRQVHDRLSGGTRNGIAAAPRSDGVDVAYVRSDAVGPYVQHARHRSGSAPEWQLTGTNRRPSDISIDLGGPLALWPASEPTAEQPRLYMVAEEVSNLGYAFAAVPDDRWHNLLDPAITSREVHVNETASWTEAAADEKNGVILLAAMRFAISHPETPSTGPGAEPSVRAVWSEDDGHTWGGSLGFGSDYWDGAKYGGTHWLQGDPTAVVLGSDNRTGYVLFHELRFAYWQHACGGATRCRSRVRIFRTRVDGSASEVPPPQDWELPAVTGNPYDCNQQQGVFAAYLDHPAMALGVPGDRLHIAWARTPGMAQGSELTAAVYYKALDGGTGKWIEPRVTVVEGVGAYKHRVWAPDVVADPVDPDLSYVLFDNYAVDPALGMFSVSRCRATSTGNSCDPCSDLPAPGIHGGHTAFGGYQIRAPGYAFAASPTTSRKLFVAYKEQIPGFLPPVEHLLHLGISNDGGLTWASLELVPRTPGKDQFAPKLGVLEDDTAVLHFYEMDSPSTGAHLVPRVAIRAPSGTWTVADNTAAIHAVPDLSIDLTRAQRRCDSGDHDRFIGDYHTFRGGLTHAHFLMAEPLRQPAPGLCRETCLWTGAASDTGF
jgi:hypothetical protein